MLATSIYCIILKLIIIYAFFSYYNANIWHAPLNVGDVTLKQYDYKCRNSSLGLVTKARACKGACQKWNLGVTFHVPGRLKVWESVKIEPLHRKWTLTLGVGILMDFQIFKKQLQGSKLIRLRSFLNHWKSLGT
jgi:hypothetical protein